MPAQGACAHCGDGKRFVVRADEKLTAFMGLESAIRRGGGVKYAQEIADSISDCQAIPYIKIRLRLTRQIRTGFRKRISHHNGS